VFQVLFVIVLTLGLQFFSLTIMIQDKLESDIFVTGARKYIWLRYVLLVFSSVLFLQEIDNGTTEFKISTYQATVKRARLPYFFRIFQLTMLLKIFLCYYTLSIVIIIILFTHIAQEQGIGIILNFTAAMIVIDFDDIAVKLFVTLKTRNLYNNFLLLKVEDKIFQHTEIGGMRIFFAPTMKGIALLMSLVALSFAIYVDKNQSDYVVKLHAVIEGYQVDADPLSFGTID